MPTDARFTRIIRDLAEYRFWGGSQALAEFVERNRDDYEELDHVLSTEVVRTLQVGDTAPRDVRELMTPVAGRDFVEVG